MAETLRIKTETAAHATISSAVVTVFRSNGITPYRSGTSSASGYVVFSMASTGYFMLTAEKPRTVFYDAMTRVVAGVNAATLTGTVYSPIMFAPSTTPICYTYGFLTRADGTPMQGSTVIVEVPAGRSVRNVNSTSYAGERYELLTDVDGFWEMPLAVGTVVRVYIPDAGVDREVVIPSLAVVNFSEISSHNDSAEI